MELIRTGSPPTAGCGLLLPGLGWCPVRGGPTWAHAFLAMHSKHNRRAHRRPNASKTERVSTTRERTTRVATPDALHSQSRTGPTRGAPAHCAVPHTTRDHVRTRHEREFAHYPARITGRAAALDVVRCSDRRRAVGCAGATRSRNGAARSDARRSAQGRRSNEQDRRRDVGTATPGSHRGASRAMAGPAACVSLSPSPAHTACGCVKETLSAVHG